MSLRIYHTPLRSHFADKRAKRNGQSVCYIVGAAPIYMFVFAHKNTLSFHYSPINIYVLDLYTLSPLADRRDTRRLPMQKYITQFVNHNIDANEVKKFN